MSGTGVLTPRPDLEFLRVVAALGSVLGGSDLADTWDEQGPAWREQTRAIRHGMAQDAP